MQAIHPVGIVSKCLQISVGLLDQGYKVALTDVSKRETALKYVKTIGEAKQNIRGGGWVHTQNLGIDKFQKRYDGEFSRA